MTDPLKSLKLIPPARNSIANVLANIGNLDSMYDTRSDPWAAKQPVVKRPHMTPIRDSGIIRASVKQDRPEEDAVMPQKPRRFLEDEDVKRSFKRGDRAVDVRKNKRVTILAAAVKREKSGEAVHKVAASGEEWLVRDSDLK